MKLPPLAVDQIWDRNCSQFIFLNFIKLSLMKNSTIHLYYDLFKRGVFNSKSCLLRSNSISYSQLGFGRLAGHIAAWQILTSRDTITLVRDQMILPPVKFLRLTHLTHLIYQNLFIFYEKIIVSKIGKHRCKAYKISNFLVPKTKKV